MLLRWLRRSVPSTRRSARRCRLSFDLLEGRLVPSTFVVTNTNDAGAGSLRQAILDANANPGYDVIDFAIGSGAQTIPLTSAALPLITDGNGTGPNGVAIDASTQPGYLGQPLIVLTGSGLAGPSNSGLSVATSTSSTLIRGLVINGFSGFGVTLSAAVRLEGCYIGTDLTGTVAVPNGQGVQVGGSANIIGGINPLARNVISGNKADGVVLNGAGNIVQNNFIGTDINGKKPLPNAGAGVRIPPGSHHNTIGGTTAHAGNVISGNTGAGITLDGADFGNANETIQGNLIGTDVSGTTALGNGSDGVTLDRATATMITANTIAFNGGAGVRVDLGSSGNSILGNSIHDNAGLGIDGSNPPSAPLLSSAVSDQQLTISGSFNSSSASSTFLLQFFANTVADPSGAGEGQRFLGQMSFSANSLGPVSFTATLPLTLPQGSQVTATQTGPDGATSLFSKDVAVTNTVALTTPNQKLVGKMYLALLGRPPEATGLATWAGQLDAGVSAADVALQIESSLEYRIDQVQAVYQTFLKRSADAQGLNDWTNFLISGGTVEGMKARFLGSPEYFQLQAGGTNLGFLVSLYRDVLGREIDATGFSTFLPMLQMAAPVDQIDVRSQIALQVLSSFEGYRALVQGYYVQYLKRPGEDAGVNGWANALVGGMRDEEVIAAFVGSPEFAASGIA